MPEAPTQQPVNHEAARAAAEAAQAQQQRVAPVAGSEALRGVQVSMDLRQ